MPPKSKVSRDTILGAAVELVRKKGADALNARSLAEELGCSTQPVFSQYATMAELRADVIRAADGIYQERLRKAVADGSLPAYKQSGLAYIHFAREERELFRLLFMRDRGPEEQRSAEVLEPILKLLQQQTGMDHDTALRFHLETWVFVHGIAAMLATDYLDWDEAFVSDMLTDAYRGLLARFGFEKKEAGE